MNDFYFQEAANGFWNCKRCFAVMNSAAKDEHRRMHQKEFLAWLSHEEQKEGLYETEPEE